MKKRKSGKQGGREGKERRKVKGKRKGRKEERERRKERRGRLSLTVKQLISPGKWTVPLLHGVGVGEGKIFKGQFTKTHQFDHFVQHKCHFVDKCITHVFITPWVYRPVMETA